MATEAQDHPNRPSTHLRINAFTHLRAYKALHLSRILYKSPTFHAKQTQFPGCSNERKYLLYKGLSKFYPAGGAKKQTQFKPNQSQSLVKDLIALVRAWMFISKTVKNSCARLWALLQCFSEKFNKPGELKAGHQYRPKLRTDPKNLLGIMPAKEGKIDLKHSFLSAVADYGSAFYLFTVNVIRVSRVSRG